jgi:hypothetical protein
MIADAAPERLRGTAFGIYDVAIAAATFTASAAAGALWMLGGSVMTFGASVCIAAAAALMLFLRRLPKVAHASS